MVIYATEKAPTCTHQWLPAACVSLSAVSDTTGPAGPQGPQGLEGEM